MITNYWTLPRIPHESRADDVAYFVIYMSTFGTVYLLFYELPWRQSGLAFVLQKISPVKDQRPQPTFVIWVLTIYLGAFGLASQRYENRRDRLENSIAIWNTQLGTSAKMEAINRSKTIQDKTLPVQPTIFDPRSVYCSLLCDEVNAHELRNEFTGMLVNALRGLEIRKKLVRTLKGDTLEVEVSESSKLRLDSIDLAKADLGGADLSGANLSGANLSEADLDGTDLSGAYLNRANLSEAELSDANLGGANLSRADLSGADLSEANLMWANLS